MFKPGIEITGWFPGLSVAGNNFAPGDHRFLDLIEEASQNLELEEDEPREKQRQYQDLPPFPALSGIQGQLCEENRLRLFKVRETILERMRQIDGMIELETDAVPQSQEDCRAIGVAIAQELFKLVSEQERLLEADRAYHGEQKLGEDPYQLGGGYVPVPPSMLEEEEAAGQSTAQ